MPLKFPLSPYTMLRTHNIAWRKLRSLFLNTVKRWKGAETQKCPNSSFSHNFCHWLQVSESCMFNRILKMPRVLIKPGSWTCHGCMQMGCAELRIYLIMVPYAAIMPEYASTRLNMYGHSWILLNVPEYAWKYLNKLFWLSQGCQ